MEKNADANPLPADLRFARARELEFVLWTVHQYASLEKGWQSSDDVLRFRLRRAAEKFEESVRVRALGVALDRDRDLDREEYACFELSQLRREDELKAYTSWLDGQLWRLHCNYAISHRWQHSRRPWTPISWHPRTSSLRH